MLGLTAATGEPVMCALIMKGKTIKADAITGIDIFADVLEKNQTEDSSKTIQGRANSSQWDLHVLSKGKKFLAWSQTLTMGPSPPSCSLPS